MDKITYRLILILTIITLSGVFVFAFLGDSRPVQAAASLYDLNSVDSNAWYFLNGSSVPPEPASGSWIVYTGDYFDKARHQDLLRNAWEGGMQLGRFIV
jgi:hypothetical protein